MNRTTACSTSSASPSQPRETAQANNDLSLETSDMNVVRRAPNGGRSREAALARWALPR